MHGKPKQPRNGFLRLFSSSLYFTIFTSGTERCSVVNSYLHISMANFLISPIVKGLISILFTSWCVSIGRLVNSFSSSLLTRSDAPMEKNSTPRFFNTSVKSLVISIPRELNPSVNTTTTIFTPVKRNIQDKKLTRLL